MLIGRGYTFAAGDDITTPKPVRGLEDIFVESISCGSMSNYAVAGVPNKLQKRVARLHKIKSKMDHIKTLLPAPHPYFTDNILAHISAEYTRLAAKLQEANRTTGQVFAWGSNKHGQLGTGPLYRYKEDEKRPDGTTIVRPSSQTVAREMRIVNVEDLSKDSKVRTDLQEPGTEPSLDLFEDVNEVAQALHSKRNKESAPAEAHRSKHSADDQVLPQVESVYMDLEVFLKSDIPRGKDEDVTEVVSISSVRIHSSVLPPASILGLPAAAIVV